MAQVLYHASPNAKLSRIDPQKTLSNDVYIGDYVFATKDKKLAAMYLANKGVATLMEHRTKKPYIIIQDDADHYTKHDKGGAIYAVSASGFKETPQVGLEGTEFVNDKAVTPLSKEVFPTSLEAMRQQGITIYFVTPKTFELLLDKNRKDKTLASLKPAVG